MTQSQLDKLRKLEDLVNDILSDEPSDYAIQEMEKPDGLLVNPGPGCFVGNAGHRQGQLQV